MLYHTADDGSAERGVVDIGIAREQDDIEVIPSTQLHFFLRRGQPVAQTMLGHYGLAALSSVSLERSSSHWR